MDCERRVALPRVLLHSALGGIAHDVSQGERLDELDIGAMRECELHDFILTVESNANAYSLALVELFDDSPALVAYPVQDAGIDEIRRLNFREPLTKATRRFFPVLRKIEPGRPDRRVGCNDDVARARNAITSELAVAAGD